ncbi:MAG: M48 family metalloprotease, partial [Solirubrobacteraceae bacterium]
TWSGWGLDVLKGASLEALLAGGAGAGVVGASRRYPRGWWAPAGAGSVIASALLAALAPLTLDPLFNEFTPLPGGETRADVLDLARAAGVHVGEVYSVDASRRGTAANAYVTGLGPSKRVVLYDTLLGQNSGYTREEIRVVVAHELAHVRYRDLARGVLYACIVAPPGALAVQRLSWAVSPVRGTPAALPALALCAALVAAPIGLVANRLSRALERRADAYALALSGSPDAFVSFERTIALQNVADLDPPRWVTSLLATHPSTGARIGAALDYKKGRAEPALD